MLRTYQLSVIALLLLLLASCSNKTVINISMDDSNIPEGETTKEDAENQSDVNEKTLDLTVETEEITTDLKDGNFIRIKFQLEVDSKQAKTELEKRQFQVKNIIIKELTQMTSEQLENFNSVEGNLKDFVNQIMSDGRVVNIAVVDKTTI